MTTTRSGPAAPALGRLEQLLEHAAARLLPRHPFTRAMTEAFDEATPGRSWRFARSMLKLRRRDLMMLGTEILRLDRMVTERAAADSKIILGNDGSGIARLRTGQPLDSIASRSRSTRRMHPNAGD